MNDKRWHRPLVIGALTILGLTAPLAGCQWLDKKAKTEPDHQPLSLDEDPSFALPSSARSSTSDSSRLGGVSKEAKAIEKRLGVSSY